VQNTEVTLNKLSLRVLAGGGLTQVVERLPNKCGALTSNPRVLSRSQVPKLYHLLWQIRQSPRSTLAGKPTEKQSYAMHAFNSPLTKIMLFNFIHNETRGMSLGILQKQVKVPGKITL
jgi:hypothetical protein